MKTARGARAPTIRDVAREAGVSVATVSRVLNELPGVSLATRDHVRSTMARLGYRRSAIARNLSVGRAQAIGVVAPFFTSASVVERVRGISDRLVERSYDLVLFDVETVRQRADAFHDFASRARVDGLIVISLPLSDDEVATVRHTGLPVVLVDIGHPDLAHVVIDDVHGGELATRHLLAKGHQRIAFIGDLPANPFGFTSSERRREGFRRALANAGITPDDGLEFRGPHGREHARALAYEVLDRKPRPTAVFAASDIQAFGVLEAARELGLRVPDDVAVVGFDDIEPAATVGLTTVRQPLRQSGVRGAELLLAAIEGGERAPIAEFEPLDVVQRLTT
jgi:DNA-binding LacI/PurR family transcriptional regulator